MSGERIVIVQAVNSLALAGAERTTAEIARGLDPEQFDAHVIVVRDGPLRERCEAAGVHVHVVGGEFDLRFPLVIARTARLLREIRPDIVHTHMIGSDITAFVAARLARVPVVLTTQHDTYRRAWPFGLFRRWSGPRLAASVAISPAVVDYCTDTLHVPRERVRVVENAVDIAAFAPALRDQRRPPTFGAIGSLIPVKDHETLLAAFARIAPSLPGARLLIAGRGPLREQLERRAQELGVGDAVELRGLTDDVPAFLGEIDILVHPSRQEAFGLAIVEAMAAAKPVIASDLPATRHVLAEGMAGMLVPPGDVDAFAEAMLALAHDQARARELGDAGFAHARVYYAAERMVGEYAALYRTLLRR